MLQTSEIGMLLDQHLFQLTCLLSTRDIRLSSRVQVGNRELLALVRGSGDLILHYISGNGEVPVIKRFLWFSDSNKKISAMCFDPSGIWLLVAGYDGSLHIVPALSLVDPKITVDPQWPTTDVTSFPSSLTKSSNSHPTSIVWWQTLLDGQHIAILGTEHGDLIFISLSSGLQVGITFVHGSISMLHLCQDNSLDSVFLLISGSEQSQWKLLLEQRATGYSWPIDSSGSAVKVVTSNTETNIQSSLELEFSSKGLTQLPTARSRLQGLKQLSVEKLTNLRQKLAETRSKNASSFGAAHFRRESSGSSSDDMSGSPAHHVTTGPAPEKLSAQIGETILCPQYSRNRNLLSGYYAPSSILTIHGMSLEEVPLFVHKLPPDCGDILVTDKFLFTVNTDRKKVYVISSQLSESRLDGDLDHNPDSIVEAYQVETDDEKILNIYKCAGIYAAASHSSKDLESRRKAHQAPFLLPKSLDEINLDAPSIDTCVIVTTKAVYEVTLRLSPARVFMDLVMNDQAIEKAEKLALMFGLNMQQLLEYAGDLKLSAKDFPLAISLYKLSREYSNRETGKKFGLDESNMWHWIASKDKLKNATTTRKSFRGPKGGKYPECRHLKSVLKFAAGGHASELLKYITMLFGTTGLDLSTSERIHLSNLAVMSYTEQVLRVHFGKPSLMDNFLKFLGENLYYDEVLAVNVAGQTGLWTVLQFLASRRGLHPEVLDILTKIIRPLKDNMNKSDGTHLPALDAGLWMCVSDPSLLQSLLAKPQNAKQLMDFVKTCLPHLKQFALQRLAALYDPSSPQLRPSLRRLFKVGCKRERLLSSSSSYSVYTVQSESSDLDMGDIGVPMEDMVQLFVLVLLYLVKQCQATNYAYIPDLMEKIKMTQDDDEDSEDLCPSLPLHANTLSAGFAHVALIKNGSVYTWGNTIKGCLGNGPTMSRFECPQPISLFPTLKLEVISVSCGHQHTLALTNNGVYAWGSSQYGQLGLGKLGQTPYPRLVGDLAKERIIAVSCGQYHSLALVDDGRLFTWGWGVHGQLGHKSIEDCRVPTLVNRMVGKVVTQICGGYAHTLVLTAEGYVYTFGSSVFGQLGNGSIMKSSVPVQVTALTERMIMISTGYFHNLAVSSSNKLYTWGASPQVLRLQAQAQKKARLLQQQAPSPSPLPEDSVPSSLLNTPEDSVNFHENTSSQESNVTSHTAPAQRDMKAVRCHTHPLADVQNDDITVVSKDSDSSDVSTSLQESPNVKQKSSMSSKNERKPSWVKDNLKSSPILNQVIFGKTPQESPASQGAASSSDSADTKSEKLTSPAAPLSSRSKTSSDSGLHLKVKPSYENKTDEVNSFPALVVSPTLEFKGLAAPLHSPPAGKELDKNVTQANEDGQLHLSPQLVDTSLVEGAITQVSCGCHHSALLTRQGVLYMWGRNLDGQVGNGSRKEVLIPTPLSSSPQKGAASVAEKLRLQQVSCGCEFTIAVDNSAAGRVWAWGNNSQAQLGRAPVEDSKGLEGKLVMLKTSKRVIKLHGSQNSSDMPKEITGIPSPGILFKSEEHPGIGLWYDQWGSSPEVCPSLCSIETPCYGPRTLHFVLQHFYGHYDSLFLLNKCLEMENYQAAAKLATLDRNYHLALSYQLKALALAYLEMNKSKNKSTKIEDNATKGEDNATKKCNEIEAENSDSVDTLNIKNQRKSSILAESRENQNKIVTCSTKTNANESFKFSNIPTTEKSVKNDDSYDSKAKTEILEKDNEVKLIIAEEKSLKSLQSVDREEEKNEHVHISVTKDEQKDISLNLTAAEEGKSECHVSSHNSADKNHLAPSGLTLKLQSNISATFNEDDSCVSTPESVTSAVVQSDNEMHTFAIQGGTEQMSEGHRFITNADSNSSPLASDEGTLTTPVGNEQEKTNFNITPPATNGLDTPKEDTSENEKNSHLRNKTTVTNINEKDNTNLLKTPKKDGALITDLISLGLKSTTTSSSSNGTSKILPDNSFIKEKYFESVKNEKGDVVLDNKAKTEAPKSEVTVAFDKLLNSGKIGMKDIENELKIHSDKPEKKKSCNDEKDMEHQELVAQAAVIVEYYISIMEEDSHSMMSRLLQQGIEFWLSHSLPVTHLEDLLLKHMSKFFYPLGLLLFCKDNVEETPLCMLNHLSTHFCLQLCSSLLGHIEKKKTYPEYVELLAQVMSAQTVPALNGCFTTGLAASQSPEQIMETVLDRLGADKSFGQPCMKIQQEITKTCQDPESSRLEQLLAFSCGHQYSLSTFQQSVLPDLELGLLQLNHPLPNTARVLRGLFSCESPNMHLACPRCVLNYLQSQKPSPV